MARTSYPTVKPTVRVTQFLYSGLGGHGSVVLSMISADEGKCLDNRLVFYGIEATRQEYIDFCEERNVAFQSVIKKRGIDIASVLQIFRVLRRFRSEITVLHSTTLIPLLVLYRIFFRTRLVFVEHNPNQVKKRIEWLWSWMGLAFANRTIYLTNEYKEEVRSRLGWWMKDRKVAVIPNGIDTSLFAPSIAPPEIGRPHRLTMIARFTPTKDQSTLVRAFAILCNIQPDNNAELILAGDGSTKESVMNLAEELGVGQRVKFPGLLGENSIVTLLKDTDIYVHASHGETMSTSIMQAMACGLPVIGSDVMGIRNIIDGKNGFLFPDGDGPALASVLSRLLGDESACKETSLIARDYALRHFSATAMLEKYIAAFTADE